MFSAASLIFVYCVLIILASIGGGHLQNVMRMTHLRTQLLMSSVGGLMLGISLLHLLPHASTTLASSAKMGYGALTGLIVMFLLIRLFHTCDHSVPVSVDDADTVCSHGHVHSDHSHHEHEHDHDHSHEHDAESYACEETEKQNQVVKGISWAGLFFGLALHTLVDGVALASSVIADNVHSPWLGLAGVGTFLAVGLHKPLDAFAITSVMNKQNWSLRAQSIVNILFSLACPIGAALFYFGAARFTDQSAVLGWGLAVSGGFFIGIALADLLPEVAFHDHDRGKLTLALLLGVGIAVAIENLPGHDHCDDSHDHYSSEPASNDTQALPTSDS
ncbi:zinc transporter ZupT [Novipirellula aureliae]|uniref:Zinc transporter ZupT n=1 Tax=Novipirellula aureliae TaxID=2527966 RepID=A0A5C6E5Y3_9BACT|nr:ZIP family metal transporter [Novipirellula aureliae]TWU43031.1 zinc transporter ZupT [Novipirellula aureliae]